MTWSLLPGMLEKDSNSILRPPWSSLGGEHPYLCAREGVETSQVVFHFNWQDLFQNCSSLRQDPVSVQSYLVIKWQQKQMPWCVSKSFNMHFACSVESLCLKKSTAGDHSFCTDELSYKIALRVRATQKQMTQTQPLPLMYSNKWKY